MKVGRKLMVCLLTAFVMCQTVYAQTAAQAEISLKAKQDDKNEKQLEVNCYMEGKEITNGKLRIFYDKDQVKLVSSEKGELLENGLCEINNCIDGNKEEGELVAAFASSSDLEESGNLLKMKFELKDGVEKDAEIEFKVKPEKLSGDSKEVSAEEASLIFVVGKSGEQIGQTPQDNEQNNGKDDGSSNSNKNPSSSGGKKTGKVKTGDDTEIIGYVALGGGALLALCVCAGALAKTGKRKR